MSKQYTFYEVISILEDDEHLKFTTNGIKIGIVGDKLQYFDAKNQDWKVLEVSMDLIHQKFELYTSFVTPIEALKAFMDGKTIELQKVDINTKNLNNIRVTSRDNNFEFNLDDLLYGEWRILE